MLRNRKGWIRRGGEGRGGEGSKGFVFVHVTEKADMSVTSDMTAFRGSKMLSGV
jgi:hypothetical protein